MNADIIGSIVSIILVFFNELFSDHVGFKKIFDRAISKYAAKDADIVRKFFNDPNNRGFLKSYFDFGTDIFGLYASAIAGIISSIGFVVSYYPFLLSFGSGILIAGVFIFIFFYVRNGVLKATIHPYSDNIEGRILTRRGLKIVIILLNLWIIVLGTLIQLKFFQE